VSIKKDLPKWITIKCYENIVAGRLKAGIEEQEWTFIAKQRLGKEVPSEMNKHATIEELPFICNGEVNTSL
jgi:hypothetical protein